MPNHLDQLKAGVMTFTPEQSFFRKHVEKSPDRNHTTGIRLVDATNLHRKTKRREELKQNRDKQQRR